MDYVYAFIVGGLICVIGQLLINLTKINPAKILVLFLVTGVVLGAFGIYDKLIDFAGAGASVPLPGFGNSLAKGVLREVEEKGFIGVFSGGMTGTSAGITAAIFFSYIMSLIFTSKTKK